LLVANAKENENESQDYGRRRLEASTLRSHYNRCCYQQLQVNAPTVRVFGGEDQSYSPSDVECRQDYQTTLVFPYQEENSTDILLSFLYILANFVLNPGHPSTDDLLWMLLGINYKLPQVLASKSRFGLLLVHHVWRTQQGWI
jgi:hypothetical protein